MSAKFGFQLTVKERSIWVFPEDIDAALAAARAQADAVRQNVTETVSRAAKSGIAYGWTRAPDEEPIRLGSFEDLSNFITKDVIEKLPESIPQPEFKVDEMFKSLVGSLPDPINAEIDNLISYAVFNLDGLRLKIPGKNSEEKMQFELAMLVDLTRLRYSLGPFTLNQLYAKLGNF